MGVVRLRGGKSEAVGEIAITPGPRSGSSTMHVDVSGFVVPGHMWTLSRDVRGTWRFEFAING